MALLSIWEFSEIVSRGGIPIADAPGILQQTPVAISVSSLQSAPFNSATRYIRLHVDSDTACCIAIGPNPTAIQPGIGRMAPNQTEYFGVHPGHQVAVIATA